jgi:TRAP-type mannitol/chloroaromatic compound transport system permease small subunit
MRSERDAPMKRLDKGLSWVDSLNEWVGKAFSYLILVLALIVGYEIVMRYIFNSPTVWVNEMSAMLFGAFMIVGGAFTARYNGHVGMDIVYGMLSVRWRAVLDVITFFILFVPLLGVLIWKGGAAAWNSVLTLEHDSSQWGPPLYPLRIMLPLGAFLFFLQASSKMIRDVIVIIKGDKEV